MASHAPQTQPSLVSGTVQVFLAEALLLPTGLITAAFLSRQLGPEGYGLFTLASTVVIWIEWSLASIFSQATITFVSGAEDWKPIGALVLRLHLWTSSAVAMLVWLLADPVADLLQEPLLASYLRLFSLGIPVFSLLHAHNHLLTGMGAFSQRAYTSAGRWIARLVLIVVLVELGLSVQGAILGSIGAALVSLAICRVFIQPTPFHPVTFPLQRFLAYAAPLFLFALVMRLYERLDLLMLKLLGGSAAEAGLYGAAQNLSIVFGLFALSFAPLLLSSLRQLLSLGQVQQAHSRGREALRVVVSVLPVTGLAAGAASELVDLIFGPAFALASGLLVFLLFSAFAFVMISVTSAILTAAGKPGWPVVLVAVLLPVAIVGHSLSIPLYGSRGAAGVTLLCTSVVALALIGAVYRVWRIYPPLGTCWRSLVLCAGAYLMAVAWPTPGLLLVLKFAVGGILILFAFAGLGEFTAEEIVWVRTLRWRRSVSATSVDTSSS